MKKYVWLAMATALLLAGTVIAGKAVKPEPVEVTVITLESKAAEKTVSCSGKIETSESKKVYTDMSCIAQEVLVSAGQTVNKGDVLFTIDVDATKQVLATMGGVSPDTIPAGTITQTITAPVSGIITTLNAAEGELTDSSKPCVVISPNSALQVKIAIHERDVKSIQVGQTVGISGVAFRKGRYPGKIKSISPSARQQYTGSVSETVVDAVVELDPAEVDDSLRLGLTAKAQVVVDSSKDMLLVPYEYVLQDTRGREYVYVLENGRAVKRVIETSDELRDGFRVEKGLSSGERIITNPESVKQNGAAVILKQETEES